MAAVITLMIMHSVKLLDSLVMVIMLLFLVLDAALLTLMDGQWLKPRQFVRN
jgi:hypothetical protein